VSRYLLDTNTISALLKNPGGTVKNHIAELGEDRICTSIIVLSELRCGVLKHSSEKLSARLESVLAGLEVIPFESPADVRYSELRVHLESRGTPIGANDLLIGAHALALDCTLVTDSEREFSRIPQLRCENWLRDTNG
jgi:tRNA(fMet)-specific endonuclease VapC